jgi:predicted nucleotidyltransferase
MRRPLDQVFVAASHVAVCRALLDTAEGMSGRQVARQAGINHQTCAVALGRLEDIGVIRRQGSGQVQLFRLNRENLVVRDLLVPLLTKEREVFPRILRRVGELLAGRCAQAMIFGSVARGEEQPESDLDLLAVAESPRVQARTRQGGDQVRAALAAEWGLRVNTIVLTRQAIETRQRRNDPLVTAILREGIAIDVDHVKRQPRASARTTTTS